ncbi:ATP-grasp domain-containing protein [Actinobacteria bacterium YIM 96077]|uniref:ATP-grasp domain-containing protein n=1 Tax=Phytoactinopolyspora halophila TaxID=1981511 RepID=A0A329R498_9ACTN|nr:ATP-grasp domain-containing protein [Phytoactinopolyspora halophila]AYY11927.1 ATP-grasp domain-containing protein [Actinobacteria bacterium YIM 96077]RAW18839.1 hypothetical protein DPM12_01925 [Phytoactinopolyspora halophila]
MMPFPPASEVELGYYELSTHLIALEVMHRGYKPRWLRRAAFVVDIDGRVLGWNMTRCTITSTIGAELTTRKDYTRKLLSEAGLTVASGGSFRPAEYGEAIRKAREIGWPVIVKPANAGKGRGVGVVASEEELNAAWQSAASGLHVVIERQQSGDEARFLVIDGECMAVVGRRPAHVIGDGHSTVAELVAEKNRARAINPHLAGHRVPLTGDPDHVPAPRERVTLDHRGGFSTGADSIDLTDDVHPSYVDIACRAERTFPQLGIAGVDIIAEDFTQPATPHNHIIIEVNSRPAIGAHHFPWEGETRDVAAAIVDACVTRRVG